MSDERVVVEREIFIAAAPETVFGFLIDPALMAHWIGLSHTLDAKPGGMFCVDCGNGNIARGEYREVVPHRRVTFTWGWETQDPLLRGLAPAASLVEIELAPRCGGTLLRLRHSGLPEGVQGIHGERWSYHLDQLNQAARLANSKKSEDRMR